MAVYLRWILAYIENIFAKVHINLLPLPSQNGKLLLVRLNKCFTWGETASRV